MEVRGKKVLILYLTDWQRRMVKDFLGVDCYYWEVPIGCGGPPVVRYGVRFPMNPNAKRMYLTDWQKREIKDEAGESCDFIELEPGTINDYGVPPNEIPDKFAINLTEEQRGIVKKTLNTECNQLEIPIVDAKRFMYGVPIDKKPKGEVLKLTEPQKEEMKRVLGASCDFIEIEKDMPILLYGVPPIPKYAVPIPTYAVPVPKYGIVPIYSIPIDEFPKTIAIELTNDQIKIAKEVLGGDCRHLEIPIDKIHHVMYRVAPDKNVRGKILELTESQKKQIKEVFGVSCDFIEIEKSGAIFKYGMPPITKYAVPRPAYAVPVPKYAVPIDEFPERIKIELDEDQRKIVKDAMKVDCYHLEIPIIDKRQWVMYRVNPDKNVRGKILKFTEVQKKQIEKVFGASCDFVELTEGGPIIAYGVPPKDPDTGTC